MNSTATSYATADAALTAVLDAVPEQAWTAPSPCAGWTARDVLQHMIDTQRDFLTGRGIDLGPALEATADPTADPAAAWRDHAGRVLATLADDAVVAAGYDGHFGPSTVGATFEQFYVWDMVVHRWDIARTAGLDAGLTAAELDAIESGADSFGGALYMEGVCRPGVEAAEDADREARLLARLGRAA
jgi:uncharacterized protein (TIGR03086 family)